MGVLIWKVWAGLRTQEREPEKSLGSLPFRRSLYQNKDPKRHHPDKPHKGGNRKYVIELRHNPYPLLNHHHTFNISTFRHESRKNHALKRIPHIENPPCW